MKEAPKALFIPNFRPPKDVEVLKVSGSSKKKIEPTLWFKVGSMMFGVTREQAIKAGWLTH